MVEITLESDVQDPAETMDEKRKREWLQFVDNPWVEQVCAICSAKGQMPGYCGITWLLRTGFLHIMDPCCPICATRLVHIRMLAFPEEADYLERNLQLYHDNWCDM
jgi:hypothetical protein